MHYQYDASGNRVKRIIEVAQPIAPPQSNNNSKLTEINGIVADTSASLSNPTSTSLSNPTSTSLSNPT